MRENFPWAGEQSDSSVVLTVLATTFTFVEWENNPFPPIIWDMTWFFITVPMGIRNTVFWP